MEVLRALIIVFFFIHEADIKHHNFGISFNQFGIWQDRAIKLDTVMLKFIF